MSTKLSVPQISEIFHFLKLGTQVLKKLGNNILVLQWFKTNDFIKSNFRGFDWNDFIESNFQGFKSNDFIESDCLKS